MRYHQITEERYRNGTWQNALVKLAQGYLYGVGTGTCYAHLGVRLSALNPAEATIRFWGKKASGIVVHGDAILPDGKIISSMPPEQYEKAGYEIVHEMPFDEFKQWAEQSRQLS